MSEDLTRRQLEEIRVMVSDMGIPSMRTDTVGIWLRLETWAALLRMAERSLPPETEPPTPVRQFETP